MPIDRRRHAGISLSESTRTNSFRLNGVLRRDVILAAGPHDLCPDTKTRHHVSSTTKPARWHKQHCMNFRVPEILPVGSGRLYAEREADSRSMTSHSGEDTVNSLMPTPRCSRLHQAQDPEVPIFSWQFPAPSAIAHRDVDQEARFSTSSAAIREPCVPEAGARRIGR